MTNISIIINSPENNPENNLRIITNDNRSNQIQFMIPYKGYGLEITTKGSYEENRYNMAPCHPEWFFISLLPMCLHL